MNTELNIPDFKITKNERLWLNEIYNHFKQEQNPDYKSLRIKLLKQLPSNFNPRNIDRRLLSHNGEKLTLLGIHFLDPKSGILEKANKIVKSIKEMILSDPHITRIEIKDVIKETSLSDYEVQTILQLINVYGSFWTAASGRSEEEGYSSISFDNNRDDECFHQYISFEDIADLINAYFEEQNYQNKKRMHSPMISDRVPKKGIIEASAIPKYTFDYSDQNLLEVDPIFKSKIEIIDPKLCFVLMPFTEDWSTRVYTKLVRPIVEELGLQCVRADNLTGPIVIEDIWTKINQSAFIIADVTGRNPNVMYELGIVHTIGKPAILMTQEIDKIPFDFKHLRHYPYKDNVEGFESFGLELKKFIYSLYEEQFPDVELNSI